MQWTIPVVHCTALKYHPAESVTSDFFVADPTESRHLDLRHRTSDVGDFNGLLGSACAQEEARIVKT